MHWGRGGGGKGVSSVHWWKISIVVEHPTALMMYPQYTDDILPLNALHNTQCTDDAHPNALHFPNAMMISYPMH